MAGRVGYVPYAPTTTYESRDNISELILRAGEAAARGQERSGAIWGGAVQDLGNIGAQAYSDYQHTKAEERTREARVQQEQAWGTYLEGGEWQTDPLDAYKASRKIFGDKEGAEQFQALMAVQKLTKGEVKSPEQAQEYLGHTAVAVSKLSGESRARFWPVLRQAAAGVGLELGETYDPAQHDPMIQEYAKAFGKAGEKKYLQVSQGEKVIDPETGQTIAEGAPKEDTRSLDARYAAAIAAGDQATAQGLLRAKAQLEAAGRAPAGSGSRMWVTRDGKPVRIAENEIQPGDLPYESARTAVKKMPAGTATELADMQTGLDESKVIRTTLSGGTAGVMSQIGAAIPLATKLTGWGEGAKQQQAVIARVKQVIGKSLEGGVLRKEDEIKYAKIIPEMNDSSKTVGAKLDGLDAMIAKKKENTLAALSDAGYDTSAFEARAAAPTAAVEDSLLKKYGY